MFSSIIKLFSLIIKFCNSYIERFFLWKYNRKQLQHLKYLQKRNRENRRELMAYLGAAGTCCELCHGNILRVGKNTVHFKGEIVLAKYDTGVEREYKECGLNLAHIVGLTLKEICKGTT